MENRCRMLRSACMLLLLCCLVGLGKSKPPPVCVLGAGPSGVAAAMELERLGYRVLVLEKRATAGGRAFNYVHKGTPFEMGAVLVGSHYTTVRKLARSFNVTVDRIAYTRANFDGPGLVNGNIAAAAPRALTREQLQAGSSGGAAAASAALLSFLAQFIVQRPDFQRTPGFLPLPSDGAGSAFDTSSLFAPVLPWLISNNLTALLPAFRDMTNYGYGPLDTIPVMYMTKTVTPGVLLNGALAPPGTTVHRRLRETFQGLMQRIAASLEDVRYGVTVTKVSRPSCRASSRRCTKPVEIEYTVVSNGRTRRRTVDCSSLIVAFPQRLQDMQFMDLSSTERQLFGKVKTQEYWTTLVDLSPFFNSTRPLPFEIYSDLLDLRQWPPNSPAQILRPVAVGEGEPLAVLSSVKSQPAVVIVYSYSRTPTNQSAITTKIKAFAKNLWDIDVPDSSILSVNRWDNYFPSVGTEDLASGFYPQLEALQGARKTFYTGALLGFDTVENSMEYSLDLVHRIFAPDSNRN